MLEKTEVSALTPDWSREELHRWWDPSYQLLKSIRQYHYWEKRWGLIGRFIQKWTVLEHRFWSAIASADIPLNCRIEGGLHLPHPNGVVIHPSVTIGPNCLILQQVTIAKDVKIGGNVNIGAGAKILRAVSIGNHVKIGANAVVLRDIPSGATAVGIPARIIPAHQAKKT